MANLAVFDPSESYTVDEQSLQSQLHDPLYHTAYRDEALRGRVWFTVVNGLVYDVRERIEAINGKFPAPSMENIR